MKQLFSVIFLATLLFLTGCDLESYFNEETNKQSDDTKEPILSTSKQLTTSIGQGPIDYLSNATASDNKDGDLRDC